jgi:prolipoprotein diacylglyceryltransferase
MGQVLFWIPIYTSWTPQGIPVYGFGVMLCLAFIMAAWVATRRGVRVGIPADKLQDLIMWTLILGVIGGRVLYVYMNDQWENFFAIWNGGLVFYGGAIGGAIGAIAAYRRLLKPLGITAWQVADVLAPATAVGLCLGRLGCFLNGCCWGHCAPPDQYAVHFPALTAPARDQLVLGGKQTLTGFAMDNKAKDERTVGFIEPHSPAAKAGLQAGDVIVAINGIAIPDYAALEQLLGREWPRGETKMILKIRRGDTELDLPPYQPRLIGLYPTQVYESISAALLFLALTVTYPYRKYDGQLIVLLMLAYAVHRFVNESLRDDTPKYVFFTLSQWISVGIFTAGLLLGALRRWKLRRATTAK